MMNDDHIEAEAHEVSLSRWPITHRPKEYILGEKWRLGFVVGAVWAKARTLERVPQVTINREHGKPATCEVRRDGVLIFTGRDYSSDIQVTQEITDAEVRGAWDALGPRITISLEYEDVRAALAAAKEARA